MAPTLEQLIRESENEIRICKKLLIEYSTNNELKHLYTIKILHYEFMICRLRRHLDKEVTPQTWCIIEEKN